MTPSRQQQQGPLEVLNRLKEQAKAEWISCDRGTEDSFAYIIDVLFPLAEMQMRKSPRPDDCLLITDEELVTIWNGYKNTIPILERIRSRPHTSATSPAPDHKAPICENCGLDSTTCRMDMAGCLQAQNAAAKAAREQFAKDLHDEVALLLFENEDIEVGRPFLSALVGIIESLRQPEPQQEGR